MHKDCKGAHQGGYVSWGRTLIILYEADGDAYQKFRIRPLKETNLGVAQAFCVP